MRTIVARLIQFETQLFKELGNATGKLDGAVKNLLNHAELENAGGHYSELIALQLDAS